MSLNHTQGAAAPPASTLSALALLRSALLLLVLALGLTGCGGGGGGGGGGGASSNTIVRGIVLNSADSDRGLQGATITIGGKSATTRTVDNASEATPVGSFEIAGPASGATTAVITPVGQAPQTVAFEPAVQSGATLEVTLYVNIGQIRGRILLPDGSPAAAGFVTVSTPTDVFTVQTNAQGIFLATEVQTGEANVSIVQGTASAQRTVPVANGLNEIGDITLTDDPNVTPPGGPFTLTGRVSINNGLFAAGSNVILTRNGIQIESTVTDANGRYSFYVPVGTYGVRIVRSGFVEVERNDLVISNPSVPLTVEDIALTEVQ